MPAQRTAESLLAEILDVAQEHLRWQRAAVLPEVRKTIEQTLTTTQYRRAYRLCDGARKSNDIAEEVGASKQAMSGWTRRWRDLGIAFENSDRKIQHLTNLKALGIPLEVNEASEGGSGRAHSGPARRRSAEAQDGE